MCAGEEVPEEVKAQERAQWQWRLGCLGRPLPGAALEDSADELKGIANYEGLHAVPVPVILQAQSITLRQFLALGCYAVYADLLLTPGSFPRAANDYSCFMRSSQDSILASYQLTLTGMKLQTLSCTLNRPQKNKLVASSRLQISAWHANHNQLKGIPAHMLTGSLCRSL